MSARHQLLRDLSKISSKMLVMYVDLYLQPTIGIDFLCRNITIAERTYRLQLWDTAGQEKYKSLVPAYLRDANCAVFVVDITRPETLANLAGWVQLFRDNEK